MEIIGEASNGVEAVEAVRVSRPHVVVMDINMPKMNGIQATQRIKNTFPDPAESAVEELCPAIEAAVVPKADPSHTPSELKVLHQQL